jgi:hypothetical protein
MRRIVLPEGLFCQLRRAAVRCAGCGTSARCAASTLCWVWYDGSLCAALVVGSVIVCWAWFQIAARCAERDRVRRVIQIAARCAGVVGCWCGTIMPLPIQNGEPGRRTRRCSRPLRARDRWHFEVVACACGS